MAGKAGIAFPSSRAGPAGSRAGQVSKQMTNTTDIFATVASVVGFQLPDDVAVDSYDMLPAMLGTQQTRMTRSGRTC